MLAAILALYTAIIGFGGSGVGTIVRLLLLGVLIGFASTLRQDRWARVIAIGLGLLMIVAAGFAGVRANDQLAYAVIGGCSFVLIAAAMGAIASTLVGRLVVDATTVLGVLCIYLLLALLFASLNQLLGAYSPHYLNGTGARATPSDLLYFSVITLATVGYGDITPASEAARAVSVVEALIGQLYLVSVVAGVVGGWGASRRNSSGT